MDYQEIMRDIASGLTGENEKRYTVLNGTNGKVQRP